MRPARVPVGLHLAQAARVVSRGFDQALATAGGSLPVWLVLLNIKTRQLANQRELAEAVGIREATLTHHLNAMEADGLITRRRHEANRRIHIVQLTDAGDATFLRLRDAAIAFDRRLRRGLTDTELAALGDALNQLAANVGGADGQLPWAGLAADRS
ncbi:MAG TPA: MarR family transcriptional regulator [Streptosporangiaceae bacterium]|nr:MarR family transcriptional regulator [Streptosporangiaceae bacterium]